MGRWSEITGKGKGVKGFVRDVWSGILMLGGGGTGNLREWDKSFEVALSNGEIVKFGEKRIGDVVGIIRGCIDGVAGEFSGIEGTRKEGFRCWWKFDNGR